MASRLSDKKLSRALSHLLDEIGFDRSQRWERIHHWNIQTFLKDLSMKLCINTDNQRVFIGSLREGIGFCGLSDIDVLQVDHRIKCIGRDINELNETTLILRIVESGAPPGYCLLEFTDSSTQANTMDSLTYALVKQNNKTYLSSKLFVTKHDDDNLKVSEFIKANTYYQTRHGPSIPKYVSMQNEKYLFTLFGLTCNDKIDFVRGFACDGHPALRAWQHRPRVSNWPSRKSVCSIMNLPVYVVPVGQDGSINEDIQWRISFVEAETFLVKNLNSVQVRILVLLKLAVKHYMKEDCSCITSYVVKNVVFWLAETIPQKKFRQKHLIARLQDALRFLIQAVQREKLQCYMQPDRNLFANKLNKTQKGQVLDKLTYLLVHGRLFVAAYIFDEQSAHTAFDDILLDLEIFHITSKMEICKCALYPIESQILFYLTEYKMNDAKESFLYNISMFPRYLWVYGIKGFENCRTVSINQQLATSDNYHRNREIGHKMLKSKETIQNASSIQCGIVRIIACILRVIIMLLITRLYMYGYLLLDNLFSP